MIATTLMALFTGCPTTTTIIGDTTGEDTAAADPAEDSGSDTAPESDARVCVGAWTGTLTFTMQDPRGGAAAEACTGDVQLNILASGVVTGEGRCEGESSGDPSAPPPPAFDLVFSGDATELCALTGEVTLTFGPDSDTASASWQGQSNALELSLGWEDELPLPGGSSGGPETVAYTAVGELSR